MKFNTLFAKLPFSHQKKEDAEKRIQDAEIKAKEIVLTAKEEALKIERNAEAEIKKTTQDTLQLEKKLHDREVELEATQKKIDAEHKK
jgi:vacuolar-type H+-ATPase subunit H